MIYLKNFSQYNCFLDIISNQEIISENLGCNTNGWYYKENNDISKLFVKDSALFFSWKDCAAKILDDSIIKLYTLKKIDNNSVKKQVELYNDKELFLSFYYTAVFGYSFMNPFDDWNETEEDWDWGLFVANIINNKKRKKEIIDFLSK